MTTVNSHFQHIVTYKNKSYYLMVPEKKLSVDVYNSDGKIGDATTKIMEEGYNLDKYTGVISSSDDPDVNIEILNDADVSLEMDKYLKVDDIQINLTTDLKNLRLDAEKSGFNVDLPISDYIFRTVIVAKLLTMDYYYNDNYIAVNIDTIKSVGESIVYTLHIRPEVNAGALNLEEISATINAEAVEFENASFQEGAHSSFPVSNCFGSAAAAAATGMCHSSGTGQDAELRVEFTAPPGELIVTIKNRTDDAAAAERITGADVWVTAGSIDDNTDVKIGRPHIVVMSQTSETETITFNLEDTTIGVHIELNGDEHIISAGTNDASLFESLYSSGVTHMVVVKNLNENQLESTLYASYINKNTALNQNIALKYILIFFIVISLVNMSINYESINISHLLIFVIFLIYYYYYDYFASYILLKFKDAIDRTKTVNPVNQIISYLKILILCFITLFLPIMVFSLFNTDVFENQYTDTSVSETIESASSNAASSIDYMKDIADEGAELANSAADAASNLNADKIKESVNNVGNQVVGNIKDTIKNA
jgi:hypothetical protein